MQTKLNTRVSSQEYEGLRTLSNRYGVSISRILALGAALTIRYERRRGKLPLRVREQKRMGGGET